MFDLSYDVTTELLAFSIKVTAIGLICALAIRLSSNPVLKHRIGVAMLLAMLALPITSWVLPPFELPILSRPAQVSVQSGSPTLETSSFPQDTPIQQAEPGQEVFNKAAVAVEPDGESRLDNAATIANSDLASADSPNLPLHVVSGLSMIWPLFVSTLYFCVAAFFLARMLWGVRLIRATIAGGKRLTELESHSSFGSEVRVIESQHVRSPMMFGFYKPVVLLPCSWASWRPDKIESVIAHEKAHITRGDGLVAVLTEMNVALFWFHPIAWALRKYLARVAETCCDDLVLATSDDSDYRAIYATHLLEIASELSSKSSVERSQFVLTMAASTTLESRIDNILSLSRALGRPLGKFASLTVATVCITTTLCASALGLTYAVVETSGSVAEVRPSESTFTVQQEPAPEGLVYEGQLLDTDGNPVEGAGVYLLEHALIANEESQRNKFLPTLEPLARTDVDGKFRVTSTMSGEAIKRGGHAAEWELETLVLATSDRGIASAEALAFEITGNWKKNASIEGILKRVDDACKKLDSVLHLPVLNKPLTGKIVDSQGKPIVGARVRPVIFRDLTNETLKDYYTRTKFNLFQTTYVGKVSENLATETGANGEFTIGNVPKNHVAVVRVQSDGHVQKLFRLQNLQPGNFDAGHGRIVHAPNCTIVLERSVKIFGTIRDAETRRPIEGALVYSSNTFTKSDKDGKYELKGLPLAKANRVTFTGESSQAIIKKLVVVDTTLGEKEHNLVLETGLTLNVSARRPSEEGIKGIVGFWPIASLSDQTSGTGGRTNKHGKTQFVAPKKEGFLVFTATGKGAGDFVAVETPAEMLAKKFRSGSYHYVKKMDLGNSQTTLDIDIELGGVPSIQIQLLDSSGEPLLPADENVLAYGLSPIDRQKRPGFESKFPSQWQKFDGKLRGKIEEPRLIVVVDQQNQLSGTVRVAEPVQKPVVVKMEPWGTVSGQLLDPAGKPKPDARIEVNTMTKVVRDRNKKGALYGRVVKVVGFPFPEFMGNGRTNEAFKLRTDANGRFKITGLVTGQKYRFAVEGDSIREFTANVPNEGEQVFHQRNMVKFFDAAVESGDKDLGKIKIGRDSVVGDSQNAPN